MWLGNYVSEIVHYYEHWLSEQRIPNGRQTQNQDLLNSPAASVVIDRKLDYIFKFYIAVFHNLTKPGFKLCSVSVVLLQL